MKFKTRQEGEWFQIHEDQRICCCDCGLAHNIKFKIVKGKLFISATRNNRSTAMLRRNRKHDLRCK